MVVRITDTADIDQIVEAFTKEAKRGSGNCGFDVYKLTFIGEGKSIVIRPASDECDTVQLGESEQDNAENMYLMGRANRKKLSGILARYGIVMHYIEPE